MKNKFRFVKIRTSRRSFIPSILATALALALATPTAQAETWVPTAAGTTYQWGTGANWSPATVPNSTTAVANINNNIAGAQTVNLATGTAANRTVNDLNLGDSAATAFAFTIAPGVAGSTLIFGGTTPSLDITGQNTANIISAPVQFNAATVLRSQTTGLNTFSGGLRDGGVARAITFNNDTNGTPRAAASTEGQFAVTTVAATFAAGTTIAVNDVRLQSNFANALGAAATNSVSMSGAGQLYLSGGTHINNVVLNSTGWVETAGNLGSLRVETNAILNGTVTLQQNSIISTFSGTGTIGGEISGGFSLTKVGAGTLVLSGTNIYGGATNINAGTLTISNPSALGNTTGNTVVASGATLRLSTLSPFTLNEPLTLTGTGTGATENTYGAVILNVNTGQFTLGGAITLSGAAAINTYLAGQANIQITQGIVGTGDLTLRASAANNGGALYRLQAASSYIGNTTFSCLATDANGIIVQNEINNALPTATVLTLASDAGENAIYRLNGFEQTVAGMQISGTGTLNAIVGGSASLSTLKVENSAPYTFAGKLGHTGTNDNNLTLTKTGSGTLTLSNTGNTFTGVVNISDGVLAVPGNNGAAGDPTALGGGEKFINLTNGGTLRITSNSNPTGTNTKKFNFGTGGGTFDINNNVTLTLDDNTGATAQLQGSGDLTKTGTGNLALGYINQAAGGFSGFTGNIIVNDGSLVVGHPDALGSSVTGTTTIASGAALTVATNASNPLNVAENLSLSGTGVSATGALINAQSIPTTFTGTVTLAADTSISVTGTGGLSLNGTISGGGFGITKIGIGRLSLGGTNNYTGGTVVNAGYLNVSGSLDTTSAISVIPNVASGAGFSLSSGTANPISSTAALTYGSATGPTSLGFELGANTAGSDSINTTQAATTTGTVNIGILSIAGFGGAATYDLISAPSGLSGATYVLSSAPAGYNYNLIVSDTLVQLGVTPAAVATGDIFWRGNLSTTSWSALSGSNTNWFTTAAGSTNAQSNPVAGNTVNFSTVNATNNVGVITTTLDNNFTVNDVVFTNAPNGVNTVTVAGGTTPGGLPGILAIAPTSSTDGINVGSNAGNVSISAPVVLGAAQTWSVDGTGANGSSLTVSGPVTGIGTLDISGLVTLSAPNATNTYSGATTVLSGSILQSGATTSFSASSAIAVNGTGIVRLNGFSNTIAALSGNGTVQNNHAATAATLTVGDATDTTFSGSVQNGGVGTLALNKTGAGILTLSGSNSYTGGTTITAGTIRQGVANALPSGRALTVNGTSVFDLNGADASVSTLSGAATGLVTDSAAGTGTSTLSITAAGISAVAITNGTRTMALRVTNENGNFNLTNGSNTFSGGIVLTNSVAGTRMQPGVVTAGAYGTGPITIGESPTDKAGIFFSTADQTMSNPIIVNTALGTDRVGIRFDGIGMILSGQITANLAPVTFSSNGTGAATLTGKITGSQGLILDSSASGGSITITLNNSSANNDYAGDTVIGQNATNGRVRTLQIGTADQIPNGVGAGNVFINTNGTGIGLLSLAAVSETINGLNGNGNVASTSGIVTLTIGDNNANGSHSGAINNTDGTLSVTKIGSGTQTLSGASNFAGALTVNGGLVKFPSAPATVGPLGNSTAVNLSGGGISYTGSTSIPLLRTIAIGASTGTVDVENVAGSLTIASVTSSAGNLIKTGPGTAVISGSTTLNAGAAGVEVNQGTLRTGFGTAGVSTISVGATANLDQNNGSIESLVLGNATGALTLSGGAQLGFEVTNALTNDSIAVGVSGTAVTSGMVTLNLFGTVAAGTYNLLTAPSGLAAANYMIGVAPSGFKYTINESDTLVSVTVAAEMPIYWRGGQNLSWNTLGSATANWTTDGAGTIDALSIPVATDAVIFSATGAPSGSVITTLDAAFTVDSLQFSSVPGSTNITIAAGTGGVLTLSPLSATGGIRVLTNGGNATISAPLTVGTSQTWDVDPTGSLTVSGDTIFTGNVNKINTGALTLSGTNSGSGAITLSAGTLNINSATALGSGIFTIGLGTTIDTPSGAIALTNNNVQNWNGNFTFTGTNDLNLGTGAVTLGSSLIATTTTLGKTLTVGGNISDGGNNRGLTKVGAGTIVLGGASSFTGPITLTGGILRITNNTALGTAAGGVTQSGSSALELDGSVGAITVGNEALTINGGGATLPTANLGALRNIAGNNTYGGTVTLGSQTRINSDSDTLTLSNPTAVSGTNQNLVVGGAGNLTISGAIATGSGFVSKDGTGILTLSGANSYTGNTTIAAGRVVVTGSTNQGAGTDVLVATAATGNAVLNIQGSMTARYLSVGGVAGASGAVNISTGGTFNVAGGDTELGFTFGAGATTGGYGSLRMTDGIVNAKRFQFGGQNVAAQNGVGVGLISGGIVNADAYVILARYGTSPGTIGSLTVATGGTLNHNALTAGHNFGLGWQGAGRAELNLTGGTITSSTGRVVGFGAGGALWTGTGILNLDAGTLTTTAITTAGGAGAKAYLNFNGGTLKAVSTQAAFLPSLTGVYVNGAFGSYSGGAVIDSNGVAVTIPASLIAPTGDGVTTIPVTDGGSGYIGAPAISITDGGSGFGATAIANMVDDGTGNGTLKIDSITITNPGNDYTAPAASLVGGGNGVTAATLGTLTTATNTSGGLTKINPGTLILTGANTYTGPTLISGGTLQLNGSAAATPTTSAVTVSTGGTLAFTTASPTTLDLSTKDMTLSGGTLAFDISDAGISDAITVDDFTLTANSAFSFNSIGIVGGSYTLVTSANPITTGGNTISGQTIGRVTLTPTINTNTITVGASLYEGKWNQDGGGNWSLGDPNMTQGNWDNYKPTVAGDAALFGDSIDAASTVAVDTTHIVGYMRFDNAFAYTIGSNASSNLILNNNTSPAVVTVTSGSHTIAENTALISNLDVLTAASTTLTISGALSGASKSLDVNGPGTVVLSGANTYTGNTTVNGSTLNITGSINGNTTTSTLAYGTTAGKTVVNHSGVLTAHKMTGADVAGAVTVFNQTAGSVTIVPTNGQDVQWVAKTGYGALNITGGIFNTGRFDLDAQAGTDAVGTVYVGGTGVFNNNVGDWLILARGGNNLAQLTVGPGGSLVRGPAVTAQLAITMDGINSHGTLNIAGGSVDTGLRAIQFGFGSNASHTGNQGFVNLAGGTLNFGLAVNQTNVNGSTSAFFNFAGGTLKANAALAAFIPATSAAGHTMTSTIYGPITNNNNANTAFNTQIGTSSNFIGGLTVDTNGFATTFTNAFRAASGFAVTQANIGDVSLLSGNSGYIGAPAVVFSDPAAPGAVPASGYAVIDPVLGTVTGIVITNPGVYAENETPTITLSGGGGNIAPFTTSALATPNTSGGLTKIGAATLTLSGVNTYTGLTTVSEGTINLGNIDALGTTAAGTTVASGSRVTFGSLTTGSTVAESFNIAGTGTDLTNGVLNVGSNKTITLSGAITLAADARITTDGGSAFNFTSASGISGTGTSLAFNTDGSLASSISGPLSLGIGSLTKTGTSTLTLSGNNSYSGGTVLSGGIIQANHNNALGSNAVVITGTRLSVGDGITIANPITIDGPNTGAGGRGLIEASAGTAIVSGPITINSAPGGGGHFASVGAAILDVQGVITSSVTVVPRSGTVMFSGGGTGYTDLTVGQGTTMVGANDGIATTAEVTIGASAAGNLDLNGYNQSLAGIIKGANAGVIGNSSTTADSVLTTTGTSLFAGLIQDVLGTGTRTVALTVASGDLTLTNTNSSYSGGTTVNQGTLSLGANGRPGASTGTLSVNNTNTGAANATVLNLATAVNITTGSLSGTIAVATPASPANTATINIPTGRTFTVNQTVAGTYEGSLAGDGGLTLGALSTNTLTLTGVNTYTGNTLINAGTLALADNAQLRIVLGVTSGTNNNLSGAGTVTLDGDFVIDTTAADALATGTWTIVDHATLTESYTTNFTVSGFTPVGGTKWEKSNGLTKKYTFDETTGVLTLGPSASYASWINGFFPGETDPLIIGAGADPDKDGIANGVEMVIGGNPATGMDTALLPTIELVNADPDGDTTFSDYLLFTYRRSDLSVVAGVTADCETDTDLVGPWTAATGAPGVIIQVDNNFTFSPPAAADTDRVRVYVPRGANTKLFGRLNVQVP